MIYKLKNKDKLQQELDL